MSKFYIIIFFLLSLNTAYSQGTKPLSNLLTTDDLKEGYFYNSKSRSTDRLGMYWICGDTKRSQFHIYCSRYDYEAFDSDIGCLSFDAKINNQNHQLLCQAKMPYKDCACQAKQLNQLLKKPGDFCILANAWDMLDKDSFFKKELSWVYYKTKSIHGISTREDGCKQ
jgi:hypothetical protein